MARYAVECVDKETGNPYMVTVDAETAQQAVFEASKAHVAGRAFPMRADGPAPANAAVVDQLRELRLQQAYRHRQVHGFSPVRAVSLLVVVLLVAVVLAAVVL